MIDPSESSDRRPTEFILFALLFAGIVLGLAGVILTAIPILAMGGLLITCGVAGFALAHAG